MRLPSACATSVPFCARYQFSRVFSLSGEKNDYIWKFLEGFRSQRSKSTRKVSEDMALSADPSTVDLSSETTQQDDRGKTEVNMGTVLQGLQTTLAQLAKNSEQTDRSHSEFEGGHSSLLWRR